MEAGLALNIELQMSLLLLVSLVGYLVAQRIGQSAVIGEILVGIAVGPSLLGLITYTDFVSTLGTMGAIFLLFVVGLHSKFEEIFRLDYLWIALAGVIVPWIGGFGLAYLWGFPLAESVLVGTALTATSIAITAQVLKEMGKLGAPVAKAIIGAAVIDDILSLLALSAAAEFAKGEVSIVALGLLAVKAGVFLAIGSWAGRNIISPRVKKMHEWALRHGFENMSFIAAIATAFLYSVVAEIIGLSAIVGAFIAGVSIGEAEIGKHKEGAEYLEAIFASVFFVSLGVLVNVAEAGAALAFLAALTIVAIVTKLVGCGLPAKLLGMNLRDAAIVGVGMTPRGEVAMIVGLYGLNAGLLGQAAYSAILLMSLLTTLVTPVFLKKLFAANQDLAAGTV